jgi:(p)ppGpp synthase/HD superfamily hydrolase
VKTSNVHFYSKQKRASNRTGAPTHTHKTHTPHPPPPTTTDACWAGLNIYASLAEKAGMALVKNAIEERAFRFLMPGEYARVSAQLEARGEQHRRVLQQARREVMQALLEDGAFMNAVERVEVKGE